MERLTAGNYRLFLESYASIYDNGNDDLQEQENIQEFLQVVNELVEDGYDLSEYTYDELYEHYLSEGGLGTVLKAVGGRVLKALGGAAKVGWKGTTVQTKQGSKFVPGAEQEVKAAIANTLRRGVKIGVPVGIAAAADQWATGGRIRGSLGQQVQSARQSAHGGQPQTARPAPTPTPEDKKKSAWDQLQSVDLFDLVKGHLLDEGYAETEDAALAIMANMSEDWRQNIVETIAGGQYNPNPIGNAIRSGTGLLKKAMSNPSVQGAIKTSTQSLQKSVPSGGYSTRPGDGKPYADGPLWDGPKKPTPQPQRKPQQAPMRDEPLW